jgi:DNA modification methylase
VKINQFINDCEFIHIDSWAKDDSYMSMIFNRVDGKSHSQILTYDVVVRKLTYEDKEAKGEIVNIYQKPQLLINYLIDICSNEGDWVLDLFSGSGKFYYMELNFNMLFF